MCVYLGSADVQTQHLSPDLERLRMQDLSYHPETCLEGGEAGVNKFKKKIQ